MDMNIKQKTKKNIPLFNYGRRDVSKIEEHYINKLKKEVRINLDEIKCAAQKKIILFAI